jgi:hypothetical protein
MKTSAREMLEKMKESAADAVEQVDNICVEAEKNVEANWPDKKFDIVPGSALLDAVYKKYGFRYEKLRDGVALSALMPSAIIDSELRNFIKSL